jgi:hypothetical protein
MNLDGSLGEPQCEHALAGAMDCLQPCSPPPGQWPERTSPRCADSARPSYSPGMLETEINNQPFLAMGRSRM